MKPIREYIRDKRVAAALAAVAVLTVGYRVVQSRDVPQAPYNQAVEAPSPTFDPAEVPAKVLPEAAPHRDARASLPPAPAVPADGSGPAWKWDRNPFLPPSAERARGTTDTGDAAAADPSMPKLHGTVAGQGGGSAIFRGDRPDGGNVLVPAGGTIGGWTLAAVEPYRVFLRRGKETRVLDLYRQ